VETNTQHHNTNTNTNAVLTIFVGLLGFVVVRKFVDPGVLNCLHSTAICPIRLVLRQQTATPSTLALRLGPA
jgi:hypothetical protein